MNLIPLFEKVIKEARNDNSKKKKYYACYRDNSFLLWENFSAVCDYNRVFEIDNAAYVVTILPSANITSYDKFVKSFGGEEIFYDSDIADYAKHAKKIRVDGWYHENHPYNDPEFHIFNQRALEVIGRKPTDEQIDEIFDDFYNKRLGKDQVIDKLICVMNITKRQSKTYFAKRIERDGYEESDDDDSPSLRYWSNRDKKMWDAINLGDKNEFFNKRKDYFYDLNDRYRVISTGEIGRAVDNGKKPFTMIIKFDDGRREMIDLEDLEKLKNRK